MNTDLGRFARRHWDRIAAVACLVAGAVVLTIGWIGVSGTGLAARQMPYIASGGIGGLFLLGTGAMLWLSADLQDEWLKFDRIEQSLDRIETILLQGAAGHDRVLEVDPAPVASPPPIVSLDVPADLTPTGAGTGSCGTRGDG